MAVKKKLKLYVIEKSVYATGVLDAMKKEKKEVAKNVYIDRDWEKNHL